MKKVFTNGCFDILHRGHIELLQYCKTLGTVIVGLNSDNSVRRLKGSQRPINKQKDRKKLLEALDCVDHVVIFSENTPLELIKEIKPDIIVKGGDYKESEVVGSDLAEVKIFNFIEGYSTTKTISKVTNKKTYVVDIDGTICTNTNGDYENAKPLYDRINKINQLYSLGNTIIFQTARGMGRHNNKADLARYDFYNFTKKQLDSWGVKYHQLFLGKPAGDKYIDDKGITDVEFFRD
jgi:rfaE bifunctional protein nucleotidyltransferase chain/domain|tara:strand:- start:6975 stop:7682 length:708 start_codon:yes stop_codon:yes gene_type:complete